MELKIKKINDKSLVLKIKDGIYYIEIQKLNNIQSGEKIELSGEIETLEKYDSMYYSVKEVVAKLNEVYDALAWDFKG